MDQTLRLLQIPNAIWVREMVIYKYEKPKKIKQKQKKKQMKNNGIQKNTRKQKTNKKQSQKKQTEKKESPSVEKTQKIVLRHFQRAPTKPQSGTAFKKSSCSAQKSDFHAAQLSPGLMAPCLRQ